MLEESGSSPRRYTSTAHVKSTISAVHLGTWVEGGALVCHAVRAQSERNGPGVLTHPGPRPLGAPGGDLPPPLPKADNDPWSWPLCSEIPGHPCQIPTRLSVCERVCVIRQELWFIREISWLTSASAFLFSTHLLLKQQLDTPGCN